MFAKKQTFVACDKLTSRTNEPRRSYAATESRLKIRRAILLEERSSMGFRVLVVGGTGQVGSGLVRALLAASSCTEVVMVNRRTIPGYPPVKASPATEMGPRLGPTTRAKISVARNPG